MSQYMRIRYLSHWLAVKTLVSLCIWAVLPHSLYFSHTAPLDSCIGAQWLSGRVLDLRLRGRGFEPHQCHCIVVLEQHTFILA